MVCQLDDDEESNLTQCQKPWSRFRLVDGPEAPAALGPGPATVKAGVSVLESSRFQVRILVFRRGLLVLAGAGSHGEGRDQRCDHRIRRRPTRTAASAH